MNNWVFTPYNLDQWNASDSRILFVAPEPNGDNPNSGVLDLGDWFRTANERNSFHSNKLFFNRTKIILDGILEGEPKDNFGHFRFMDLKATSGGSKAKPKEVSDYVKNNRQDVLEYFISKDKAFGLKPHIIVILGSNTFEIFNREIKKYLLKDKNIKWVCMPHPSARTVVNVWLSSYVVFCCEISTFLHYIRIL